MRSKYSYESYVGLFTAAVAAFAAYVWADADLVRGFPSPFIGPQAGRHAGAACAFVSGTHRATQRRSGFCCLGPELP